MAVKLLINNKVKGPSTIKLVSDGAPTSVAHANVTLNDLRSNPTHEVVNSATIKRIIHSQNGVTVIARTGIPAVGNVTQYVLTPGDGDLKFNEINATGNSETGRISIDCIAQNNHPLALSGIHVGWAGTVILEVSKDSTYNVNMETIAI